jgi:hypothetical protein
LLLSIEDFIFTSFKEGFGKTYEQYLSEKTW